MSYAAVVSLLCSWMLQGQTTAGAQPINANADGDDCVVITGHLPGSLNVVRAPSFAAALSGQINVSATAPAPSLEQSATKTEVAAAPAAIDAPVQEAAQMAGDDQDDDLRYSNIPDRLLDPSRAIDRVAAVISSNEGKPTSIDWNDNGKGVSVGIFQANQKVGELPDILHELAMLPAGQEEISTAFTPEFAQRLRTEPEVVRRLSFSPKNELGRGLQALVHGQLFQKLQVAILRRKVARAAEVAAGYGITSTAGVAVCADLTNQWGKGGAQRFLRAADTMKSEGGKVKAIVQEVCKRSRYGNRYQCDLEKMEGNGLSFNEPFSVDQQSLEMAGVQDVAQSEIVGVVNTAPQPGLPQSN